MRKISKQKNRMNLLFMLIAIFAVGFTLNSCNNGNNKKAKEEKPAESAKEKAQQEEDAWIINEDLVYDLPQINVNSTEEQPKKEEQSSTKKSSGENKKAVAMNESGTVSFPEVDALLQEKDYEPTVVAISKAIIPLDETKTVVAYTKKGKAKEAMQVISSPDKTVDQVIFYNKKHKDVYNVEVGMTGKEVKKIRKDMKHVVKNGKVFLYNDDSNIMYLMKAKNNVGDEIDTAKIDNMQVQAIIWKPTKREVKKEEKIAN